jgi:hypothetical protein
MRSCRTVQAPKSPPRLPARIQTWHGATRERLTMPWCRGTCRRRSRTARRLRHFTISISRRGPARWRIRSRWTAAGAAVPRRTIIRRSRSHGQSGLFRPRLPQRAPHSIPAEQLSELFARLGSHRDRALVAFRVSAGPARWSCQGNGRQSRSSGTDHGHPQGDTGHVAASGVEATSLRQIKVPAAVRRLGGSGLGQAPGEVVPDPGSVSVFSSSRR